MLFEYFKVDFQTSIEECKRQYRKLCMRWHPDRPNGDLKAMQKVNSEWDYLSKHNFNIHEDKDGNVYTDWNQDVPDDVTQRFAAIINAVINLDGVGIEICGSFIWLDGNTYEYREAIKALGFKWARRKKKWYMAPKKYRKSGTEWSMSEIRMRYGSHVITEGYIPQHLALKSA